MKAIAVAGWQGRSYYRTTTVGQLVAARLTAEIRLTFAASLSITKAVPAGLKSRVNG
jgi:hypothetical protein